MKTTATLYLIFFTTGLLTSADTRPAAVFDPYSPTDVAAAAATVQLPQAEPTSTVTQDTQANQRIDAAKFVPVLAVYPRFVHGERASSFMKVYFPDSRETNTPSSHYSYCDTATLPENIADIIKQHDFFVNNIRPKIGKNWVLDKHDGLGYGISEAWNHYEIPPSNRIELDNVALQDNDKTKQKDDVQKALAILEKKESGYNERSFFRDVEMNNFFIKSGEDAINKTKAHLLTLSPNDPSSREKYTTTAEILAEQNKHFRTLKIQADRVKTDGRIREETSNKLREILDPSTPLFAYFFGSSLEIKDPTPQKVHIAAVQKIVDEKYTQQLETYAERHHSVAEHAKKTAQNALGVVLTKDSKSGYPAGHDKRPIKDHPTFGPFVNEPVVFTHKRYATTVEAMELQKPDFEKMMARHLSERDLKKWNRLVKSKEWQKSSRLEQWLSFNEMKKRTRE